jgi:4-diphosphocytidyl-2-C-methyl-D-erythritol kinase
MTLRAYAKINLGLRVLRKRPDGYHDIETVFRTIDNYDIIRLAATGGDITFKTNSQALPSDSANLCLRAAFLLKDITHVSHGVNIELTKNIPIAAGLGGGSSDAAATLKGLVKLWNLALRPHELDKIALSLGSDVPFFLEGGSAYATGRGDVLEPFEFKLPYWILVVTPAIPISTTWAYGHVKLSGNSRHRSLKSIIRDDVYAPPEFLKELKNDFEPLVFETYPEVKSIRDMLLEEGAEFASLSGSGSSVFAFFSDEESASIAALKFSKTYYTSLTSPFFKAPPMDASFSNSGKS